MTGASLAERVDALEGATELGRERLAGADLDAASAIVEKVRGRLRHGTDHTVVALAGPTGAGKSSLFNAVSGVSISDVGVRRPTTGSTHACVWGSDGGRLLDWLDVGRRHHLTDGDDDLEGLVLLDLPDFDSTTTEHRLEVDRLVELVDLLVWVTDPQKYADEALHVGYLTPLAAHASVMRFVINKTDTLAPHEIDEVIGDLRRRLDEDGLRDSRIIAVSVTDGAGVADVDRLLADEVKEKSAVVARLAADLTHAAASLATDGAAEGLSKPGREALIERLGHAAGVETTADLAAAQHRRDAQRAMAWPPLRWFKRWGRDPVADLPRAGASPTATAEIASALRDAGEDAARGLTGPWPAEVRRTAQGRGVEVARVLTSATSSAVRRHRDEPRWWIPVAGLQRLLALLVAGGLLWLLAVAVLGGILRLDTDPLLVDTPGAEWIPLPSALFLGGIVAAVIVAWIARVPAAIGARRRARRVRSQLRAGVAAVADDIVIEPLDTVLAEHEEIERLLVVAAGTDPGAGR